MLLRASAAPCYFYLLVLPRLLLLPLPRLLLVPLLLQLLVLLPPLPLAATATATAPFTAPAPTHPIRLPLPQRPPTNAPSPVRYRPYPLVAVRSRWYPSVAAGVGSRRRFRRTLTHPLRHPLRLPHRISYRACSPPLRFTTCASLLPRDYAGLPASSPPHHLPRTRPRHASPVSLFSPPRAAKQQ